jgi:tetratricopeptide (TPR) repeat protein
MTNLRNMLAYIAIGSWAALGCAGEGSSEPSATADLTLESSIDANQGQPAAKVDVEGSIRSYEQAARLAPANHQILFRLARAYEKNQDWDKMASTMSSAVQLAPAVAVYWYKRGYALLMQPRAGDLERAEEALKNCIEKDPSMTECFLLLPFTTRPRPACPACGGASAPEFGGP